MSCIFYIEKRHKYKVYQHGKHADHLAKYEDPVISFYDDDGLSKDSEDQGYEEDSS